MIKNPTVSCIMLTANRHKFVPLAINNFLSQDYQNIELIIVDDGDDPVKRLLPKSDKIRYFYTERLGSIGAKRNYACNEAIGSIIMHWDDDDWYAPDWVSKQLTYLISSRADVCGIEHVHFYSPLTETFWQGTSRNRNKGYLKQWLSGATLAFWKSYWIEEPFENINTREDDFFIKRQDAKIYAHDYIDGFVAILHPKNTTVKYFEHNWEKKQQIPYER